MMDGSKDLTPINFGFVPLVDCAVPVAAKEAGFAAAEGLDLKLERKSAWASIRDRLNLGLIDAAHMLAGMPVAASLGIGQARVPTIAPMLLSVNGNAITLSCDLYERMEAYAQGDLRDPLVSAMALKAVLPQLDEPPVLAMVYPFSCHNYELRYWLGAVGIDPETDVRLVVIPPSLMAESLRRGQIDGFCVGEPWSSLAVDMGLARIVVAKADLWRWGPEKVLGISKAWADDNRHSVRALVRAFYKAAAWCDDQQNHAQLAEWLSQAHYLSVRPDIIARALSGSLVLSPGAEPELIPNFLVFHRQAASFPWRSHALWLYSQMVRWGQAPFDDHSVKIVRDCFRTDIYRSALRDVVPAPVLPSASEKLEGTLTQPVQAGASGGSLVLGPDNFFDKIPFDPEDIPKYLHSISKS